MATVFMRYPDGRAKALTLSYDDGVEQDARLIRIMQENGLKGTFNLNSGLFAPEGTVYPAGTIHRRMSLEQAKKVYAGSGMEIAVHGVTHPYLEELPTGTCVQEILEDRINLEREFGGIVRGCAYPYGTYSDSVVASLRQCGIVYARTVIASEKFDLPADWLRLPATCHHDHPRLMELADAFLDTSKIRKATLFYLWGHTYEFELHNNWDVIERFAGYMGGRENVWYATNIQIYDYVDAYSRLISSADGSRLYNPTTTELWLQRDDRIYSIAPGQTLEF